MGGGLMPDGWKLGFGAQAGYNGGLFSVSLAGWPCRVSRRWKNIVGKPVLVWASGFAAPPEG
jgi:hypothetical protein